MPMLSLFTAALIAVSNTTTSSTTPMPTTAHDVIANEQDLFEADRQAILSMSGAFRVSFRFEETVAVQPNYQLADIYNEEATELVLVIEDTGERIALQHLLVVEGRDNQPMVVKHWRQVWQFEDQSLLNYIGNETWQRHAATSDEAAGRWTQSVFQTTDAPRYEAAGRWIHRGGQSTWESDVTWRPLPRRERYRYDYDIIECRNRHTITNNGWAHEQHNQKVLLDGNGRPSKVIAHEIGLNVYERIDEADVAIAAEYWAKHADRWQAIRESWSTLLAADRIQLKSMVDDQSLDTVVSAALEDHEAMKNLSTSLAAFIEQEK